MPARALGLVLLILFLVTPAGAQTQRPDPAAALERDAIYDKLRHLEFSRDIRTRFQYNNLMYMTAGLLGGRIAGSSWEDLVRWALFEPLAMRRSGFSLADVARDPDHAQGYSLDEKRQLIPEKFESAEAMGPAGSINSTARDLTNYLRMMLAKGTFEGRRVLLESDVQAMLQLVVVGRANELIPVRGTTFKIKDVTGATIEFLRGPAGKVNRLVRHGGTDLIAPRKK